MESIDRKNGKRIVLSKTSYTSVGDALLDLIRKTRAQAVIFADMDGYPIVHRGNIDDMQISTLTALAAGSFSATSEMAKMVGEKDRFRFLYHEGERSNLYLSTVGESHLIIVAFDATVALGMIRIFTNLTVTKLNNMLDEIRAENKEATEFLDLEFRSLLSQELDKSFNLR
jgi:predicted regulator of Ras-like GTPase activity (Roadblock/LC7/MglB family)